MAQQMRAITLKCTNCGANLDVSGEMDRFACGYCGTEQIVERSGGTVSLKPVTDAIAKVQIGTDKTASELALKRLQKELQASIQECDETRRFMSRVTRNNGKYTLWSVGLIAFSFLVFNIKGFAGVGVLTILLTGIPIYLIRRSYQKRDRIKAQLQSLLSQKQIIKERMAKNRAIVDS